MRASGEPANATAGTIAEGRRPPAAAKIDSGTSPRAHGSAGPVRRNGTHDGDELATRIRVAVTRLNRRLRQQSLAGLSPAQASTLGAVNRLGTPTLGEVAEAEQVQPPTMTRLVSGMVDAGLLARLHDESDRRVSRVRVTGEGRRTLQRIRSLKNAFLNRRLVELDSAERRHAADLVTLLEHLVAEP